MNDVLVLNASYEPLAKVNRQRAIKLVFSGKAVIDEAVEGEEYRSKTMSFPVPKVIRLTRYVKVKYQFGEIPWTKQGVLKHYSYRCVFCDGKATTVEHLDPQSRYPQKAKDWLNTVAACFPCNNAKGDRTLKESGMKLLYEPTVPTQVRRVRGIH